MPRWAACISSSHTMLVASLRLFPNLEVSEVQEVIWLRGHELSADLERELKKIPGAQLFEWLDSDRLRPWSSRIPDRFLPPLMWRRIQEVFAISLPIAAPGGQNHQKLSIVLVRAVTERLANALLTSIALWSEFAIRAPQVRLDTLRFAAADNGQVLVVGSPMPPLRGMQLINAGGILVPCGFTWSPPVDASVLRDLFGLGAEDVVILFEDNTHQTIRSEQFVGASRSAARLTIMESNNG